MATMATATKPQEETKKSKRDWVPLESNPVAINKYMESLGGSTDKYEWVELLSCEEWAFGMVPSNRLAVMLNFPITEAVRNDEQLERERILKTPQSVDEGIFFCNQTIGNACGTVGIMHAVANARQQVTDFELSGWFETFFNECEGKTPMEKAEILESGEGSEELDEAHEAAATQDDTNSSAVDANLNNHFITFVCGGDNMLYELDGRKEWPVNHGPTTKETLLNDACRIIQNNFFKRDPSGFFAMTVLANKN
jgi:ubiquitin carboxyl-terminal hydrolase L3